MSSAGSQGLMAKTWYGSFPRGALRQGRNAAPPPRWGCAMVYAVDHVLARRLQVDQQD
jgi:hypothetical protein